MRRAPSKHLQQPRLNPERATKPAKVAVANASKGILVPRAEDGLLVEGLQFKEGEKVASDEPSLQPVAPRTTTAQNCDGIDITLANGKTICIKPGSGKGFKDCPLCPEMVVISPGRFMMGSTQKEVRRLSKISDDWKKWASYEAPQHQITIAKPFAIGRFEITKDQFERFAEATGHNVGDSCWTLLKNGKWGRLKGKSYLDPGYKQNSSHPASMFELEGCTSLCEVVELANEVAL